MHMTFAPAIRRTVACLALGMAAIPQAGLAQTCAAPQVVLANTATFINTCTGTTALQTACGFVPLNGPAAVLLVQLGYPAGTIAVTPQNVGFDPVLFLMQGQCNGNAACADAVDSYGPGMSETLSLNNKDSGTYFLGIGTMGFDVACGNVMIYADVPMEVVNDGLFRGGMGVVKTGF